MTTDDRLSRYLSDRADGISLTPSDPASAMRRGSRRRTRRRAGFVGGVAVVAVLAAALAVRDPSGNQQVGMSAAPNVAASSFDWNVVEPASGLGWGERTAQLADGSLYGISTAPGRYDPDDWEASATPTLYRSTDGTEWEAVSLPGGHRTSGLAGAGDILYSVGTSPAGGLVMSTSHDAASTWSSVQIESELADLKAQHGDKLVLGPVRLAAGEGNGLVAVTTAHTSAYIGSYLPEYEDGGFNWEWDESGATVYELPTVSCEEAMAVEREATGVATSAPGSGGVEFPSGECYQESSDPDEPMGTEVASYTFDELGITDDLRDLVGGKVYAFASADGETFEQVELPLGPGSRDSGLVASPLATPDGFRLVVPRYEEGSASTTVLRSSDGRSWDESASIPGGAGGVGLLGDRPALGIWGDDGASRLVVEQPSGAWSDVDLTGALSVEGGEVSASTPAFGPLGMATVLTAVDHDGDTTGRYVVHSADGADLQVVDVTDLVGAEGSVAGTTVTADAIFVRLLPPAGTSQGDDPPAQTVVVGTPRA